VAAEVRHVYLTLGVLNLASACVNSYLGYPWIAMLNGFASAMMLAVATRRGVESRHG